MAEEEKKKEKKEKQRLLVRGTKEGNEGGIGITEWGGEEGCWPVINRRHSWKMLIGQRVH